LIELGCPPHSSPSLALALSLRRTPRHMLPLCAASPSHARFHTTALSPSSLVSRARSQCPMPLSCLPSPAATSSLFCRASQSPRRGNPHAHRPAMRDVPTHAPPLRSPCPSSFMMTAGNAFEWRKIRRICHAWSQAVDACAG
jgi:hypothetical protein